MNRLAALALLAACRTAPTSTAPAPATATATVTATATATPTATATATPTPPAPTSILVAPTGLGFDDLVFAPRAHRVLLPAASTGDIAAVHPDTFSVTRLRAVPASTRAYQRDRLG